MTAATSAASRFSTPFEYLAASYDLELARRPGNVSQAEGLIRRAQAGADYALADARAQHTLALASYTAALADELYAKAAAIRAELLAQPPIRETPDR